MNITITNQSLLNLILMKKESCIKFCPYDKKDRVLTDYTITVNDLKFEKTKSAQYLKLDEVIFPEEYPVVQGFNILNSKNEKIGVLELNKPIVPTSLKWAKNRFISYSEEIVNDESK